MDGLLKSHENFTQNDRVHQYSKGLKRVSGTVAGYIYYIYSNEGNDVLKEQIQMKSR